MIYLINNIIFLDIAETKSVLQLSENALKISLTRHRNHKISAWPHRRFKFENGTWKEYGLDTRMGNIYIMFEGIRECYKEKIRQHYGCKDDATLFEYIQTLDIEKFQENDPEADDYYISYLMPTGTYLKRTEIDAYITGVKILDWIVWLKNRQWKRYFKDKRAFWVFIGNYIKTNKIKLPRSYSALRRLVAEWEDNRKYSLLISGHIGNNNASKFKDETTRAMMIEVLGNHNKHSDLTIHQAYNEAIIRHEIGKKVLISPRTVTNYRQKYMLEITETRDGKAAFYNKFGLISHRKRPSAPLFLINSDDNDLDMYFIDTRDGKKDPYFRYKLYVVKDAYNDYPLGYAFGDGPSIGLVKLAFLNAIHHIKDITGDYYYWWQLTTDNWARKSLTPWFESQCHYTPIALGNKRSNYIEQSFGKKWHKYLKALAVNNYAGHNITSRERINPDALLLNKKDFPTIDAGPEKIGEFIETLRHATNPKTGMSLQQEWLAGFKLMVPEDKKLLSDSDRLFIFGMLKEKDNRLTNAGIEFQLNNHKFIYRANLEDYINYVGHQFDIIYDPYDMNVIMASRENGRVRVMMEPFELMPGCIKDMKPCDRHRINEHNNLKKKVVEYVSIFREGTKKSLERLKIDANSILQAGLLKKEIKQEAERIYLPAAIGDTNEKTDIYDNDELFSQNWQNKKANSEKNTETKDQYDDDEKFEASYKKAMQKKEPEILDEYDIY